MAAGAAVLGLVCMAAASLAAAVWGGGGRAKKEEVSLGVIMTNT